MNTFTSSLRLEPLSSPHRRLLVAMLEDERMWTYLDGSPADADATAARFITAAVSSRRATGVGLWAAFLRTDAGDDQLPAGTFVGIGGVRETAGVWNLGLSIAPSAWGRGYATEVAAAAVDAAHTSLPGRAVTARTLARNVGSQRALVAAGLRVVWRGPSAAHPGEEALIFADLQLRDPDLDWLIRHS